jgi:4'-phosphopantetheinyl transferase
MTVSGTASKRDSDSGGRDDRSGRNLHRLASRVPTCFLSRVLTVWKVRLDSDEASIARGASWLSADEHERAARFRSPLHAARWRVSHIALRGILGAACSRDPASLRFGRDANGKPTLPDVAGLGFNLSHAGGVALVAITGGAAVGVDVEEIRSVPEMRGVAESHFASVERTALWDASEAERLHTFYRIWTRKEAFVKATGVGIGPALARFAVSASADDAQLLFAEDRADASTWRLSALDLPLPYLGAVCVQNASAAPLLLEWQMPF